MKVKKIFLMLFLGSCVLAFAEDKFTPSETTFLTGFTYDSKGKRDPFLPLVSKEGYLINREADVLATDMNLEGIIYDPSGKSLAIINGQVLKVGDTISNYSIIEIEKHRVILLRDAEKFILELKEEK